MKYLATKYVLIKLHTSALKFSETLLINNKDAVGHTNK